MLHMEPAPHQGIYAPLSQVMSESDDESEEEIHNTSKLRRQRQQQQQLQQQRNRAPPNSLPLNHQQNHNQQQQQFQKSRADDEEQRRRQRQRMLQQNDRKYYFNNGNNAGQRPHHSQQQQPAPPPPPSSYTTNMQNTFRSVMMSDMVGMAAGGHEGGGAAAPCDPSGSNFSSFNSDYDERNHIDADNVAILGGSSGDKLTNEPMSPVRRFCFVASVLLCIFAVVGFVWLVPCGDADDDGACPARPDRIKTHNWVNNYTKVELMGGAHIVSGLRSWEKNLIFLCRGNGFFPDATNSQRNGVISLIGSSGVVAWFAQMTDEPVAIDCTLIDVNRNGRPDCLVIDEYGQLSAIDPLSGQWHWNYKERSAYRVGAMDFPLMLPDLDGDGVLELLTVSSATLEQRTKFSVQQGDVRPTKAQRNALCILSGRHGTPIGEGLKLHDCDVVSRLQLEMVLPSPTVSFTCTRHNATSAQRRSKTLAELFALITNKSTLGQRPQKLMSAAMAVTQHQRRPEQRKDDSGSGNIYSLSGREMFVQNRGKCPDDCSVTIVVSEMRNGRMHVRNNVTYMGSSAMAPIQWHFKGTKMSGFVMKLLQWTSVRQFTKLPQRRQQQQQHQPQPPPKTYNTKKPKASVSKTSTSANSKPNQTANRQAPRKRSADYAAASASPEFNVFDQLVEQRHAYTIGGRTAPAGDELLRPARSINATAASGSGKTTAQSLPATANLLLDNYRMHIITEKEILVLFNGADTQVENTSQSNIVQFCRRRQSSAGTNVGAEEMLCQPDLRNQEHSMLIADLDQDGSQELVSYVSTFVSSSDADADSYGAGDDDSTASDWQLVTFVRLLRMQEELPGVYGAQVPTN